MKVEVKLYASLGKYLPEGAKANVISLDVADGTTPMDIIDDWGVPSESCHLVLINGNYIEPSARASHALKEGDALAIWPPVAGG